MLLIATVHFTVTQIWRVSLVQPSDTSTSSPLTLNAQVSAPMLVPNLKLYIPPPRQPRRAYNDSFVAWMQDDAKMIEADATLCKLRQQVALAVQKGASGVTSFLVAAREAQFYMEGLPRSHPYHLNSNLLYTGPSSPFYHQMRHMLRMCFNKAVSASTDDLSNNHSGYYLVGPRGVGKSNLLRTCCLLSGVLLPNFAAAYVEYTSVSPMLPVADVAAMAVRERGVADSPVLGMSMAEVRACAMAADVAIGLFVDEAHNLYVEQQWRALHTCLTNFTDAVFLSGSDYRLSLFIRGWSSDRAVIRRLGHPLLDSLNDTKCTPLHMTGLSSIKQYCEYLDNRPSFKRTFFYDFFHNKSDEEVCKTKTADIDGAEEVIRAIHAVFGGRIRGIVSQGIELYDSAYELPGNKLMADVLRECFFKHLDDGGFDPLNLGVVTEEAISTRLAADGHENAVSEVITMLLERHYIRRIAGGFQLHSPAVYTAIADMLPVVFVSHATSDADIVRMLAARLRPAKVILWDDVGPKSYLGSSTVEWMRKHIESVPPHKLVVFITPEYCRRVETGNNGCAEEFNRLITRLEVLKKNDPHQYAKTRDCTTFVYEADSWKDVCSEYVERKLKAAFGDMPYFYPLNEASGTIFTRVLRQAV